MIQTNHPGFTLIEVLLATLIASILSIALFTMLDQVQKSFVLVNHYVDIHTNVVVFYNRVQKDLIGATIPLLFHEQQLEQSEKAASLEKAFTQVKPVQEPGQPMATRDTLVNPPPKLDHIFYTENYEDGNLKQLTCITNSPLRTYVDKQSGKVKPLIARVWYYVEPEENLPNGVRSYRLIRKESSYLSYQENEEEKPRAYELLNRIARFKVTYTHFPQKQKNSKKPDEMSEEELHMRVTNIWNKEQFVGQDGRVDEQKKDPVVWLPDLVTLTVELWNDRYKQSTAFRFAIPLICDNNVSRKEKSKVPNLQAKQTARPAEPPARSAKPMAVGMNRRGVHVQRC